RPAKGGLAVPRSGCPRGEADPPEGDQQPIPVLKWNVSRPDRGPTAPVGLCSHRTKGTPVSDTKTFLITGVSTGLGRALARAALAAGHRVVGTVRTPVDARAFEALAGDAHARILDVTDHDAVDTVVDET